MTTELFPSFPPWRRAPNQACDRCGGRATLYVQSGKRAGFMCEDDYLAVANEWIVDTGEVTGDPIRRTWREWWYMVNPFVRRYFDAEG